MTNALENLSKVRRILVWDNEEIGQIKYRRIGFFKKKTVICYISSLGSLFSREFESEGELEEFLEENNLIRIDNTIYKKWSVDLIYGYKCSKTIYFNSKTAQNDWLKNHSNNFINVENEK